MCKNEKNLNEKYKSNAKCEMLKIINLKLIKEYFISKKALIYDLYILIHNLELEKGK